MGKHKDKSKKRDKKEKKKRKHKKEKDKKRKLEHSSDSESEQESKYSKEDRGREDEEQYKEKKKRKRNKKDYSSSSSSSSDSSSEDEREKKSKQKRKTSNFNTELLGTSISSKDYESVRNKFKVWLEQDEKTDLSLSEIESKNDLLMLHFGKFTKLWNEGTLGSMYYHKVQDQTVEKKSLTPVGVVKGPEAVGPAPDDNKYTLKGDNSLADRYLTGSRETSWIHKRVSQMRRSKEKRQNRLTAKAEAYQEKEKEKMDEFKKVMGLM